jgi:hypothetical protein
MDEEDGMATVRSVQNKIWRVEGFRLSFLHANGRNVNDNRRGIPAYPFLRQARNSWTVRGWQDNRFLPTYPGFRVAVYDSSGRRVNGNTLLGNLRDTYLD